MCYYIKPVAIFNILVLTSVYSTAGQHVNILLGWKNVDYLTIGWLGTVVGDYIYIILVVVVLLHEHYAIVRYY